MTIEDLRRKWCDYYENDDDDEWWCFGWYIMYAP